MILPTHLLAAQAAFLTGSMIVGHRPTPDELLVALLAAQLPDLDTPKSAIGQALPFVANRLGYWFGHRTFTHSLLLQAGVSLAAWFTLPFGYFLAVSLGFVSHSLADMLTLMGVGWFWPSAVRCVLPGNEKYRMETFSHGELIFAALLAATAFVLLPLAKQGENISGLIRDALGEIKAARKTYDAEKGGFAFKLRIEGRDNRSLELITGEYPIIAGHAESGFLIETPTGIKTTCQTESCDWYAERAVLMRGAPQVTRLISLDTNRLPLVRLQEALKTYEDMEVYLLGSALAGRRLERLPVITTTGEKVKFDHARPIDLIGLPAVVLREALLSVQIRTAPGVPIRELGPIHDTDQDDGLLGRWINQAMNLAENEVGTGDGLQR